MADYFLALDGATFEGEVRPALAAAWLRRSFEPCRALCASLVPAARDYADRYHTGGESLIQNVAEGLSFDRGFWRLLVGEVLLVAAVEIPEFQTAADTLYLLLAPEVGGDTLDLPRGQRPAILQAHQGSRDLTFGPATYRPDHAGYNNAADVARLADYLAALRPETWTTAALRHLEDEDERADELAFAREWFPELRELYRRAHAEGRVLVLEQVY
jgi:hypothetical protein